MKIAKLFGIMKMCKYILRSGKRIRFDGIPAMEGNARVNLRNGIAFFGRSFSMKTGAYCAIVNGGQLFIGENVSMNRNTVVVCHERILIGNHCSIAPNVMIYDHDHNYGVRGLEVGYNTSPVVIEDHCWIGGGVIILRGTHIGEGSIIGAGCIVQGNIPPHSLVVSNRDLTIKPIDEKKA